MFFHIFFIQICNKNLLGFAIRLIVNIEVIKFELWKSWKSIALPDLHPTPLFLPLALPIDFLYRLCRKRNPLCFILTNTHTFPHTQTHTKTYRVYSLWGHSGPSAGPKATSPRLHQPDCGPCLPASNWNGPALLLPAQYTGCVFVCLY